MAYEFLDYSEGLLSNAFARPAVEGAIASLDLPRGAHVLDAGCGAGAHFPMLYEAIGENGQIVGVDFTPGHLEAARQEVERLGLGDSVEVREVDLRRPLPFGAGSFDAVWVSNVISPKTVASPEDLVREFWRVLRPGGVAAIFENYGVRPCFLPGYPLLEHKIGIARCLKRVAADERWLPQWHPERSKDWLLAVGFDRVRLDIELLRHDAPLSEAAHKYIQNEVFEGYYGDMVKLYGAKAGMTADEIALWERISDVDNPECVLREPGYYCFCHTLLARGVKPPGNVK